VEVEPAILNEVYGFLKKNVGIPNDNVQIYKSIKTISSAEDKSTSSRGLISFKWEHEITQNTIRLYVFRGIKYRSARTCMIPEW
jgi:hypothetical protein